MKFDFKKHKNEKIAIWCKAKEEALDFYNQADKAGLCWCDKVRYTSENKWYHDEPEGLLFLVNIGKYALSSSLKRTEFQNQGYNIIRWSLT